MKEYILKFILLLLKIFYYISDPFYRIYMCLCYASYAKCRLPTFSNKLLEIPAIDLAEKIRLQEITSEDAVAAYIERINAVNPHLNAIVESGFPQALDLAKKADNLCRNTPIADLKTRFPLLGVPITVKESCRLQNFLCTQGSLLRSKTRSADNGEAVGRLLDAGAIPLLVSNTPEFCFNWECFNFVTGRTLNPYSGQRSSGGSSGGEGALLGSGASVIGVGSDVAGSIRIPALFNGIFGHKPTRRVVSIVGHAPYPGDATGADYLVIGPMCRYAKDLPLLLHIMAGPNAAQLNLTESVSWKNIRVFHLEQIEGSLIVPVTEDTRTAFWQVVNHFKEIGTPTEALNLDMSKSLEIALANLAVVPVDYVTSDPQDPNSSKSIYWELLKSIVGRSQFTFAALLFNLLCNQKAFIPARGGKRYRQMGEEIKERLIKLLGTDGVLVMPTCATNAWRHYEYAVNLSSLVYVIIFNALGLPCTHVPTGLSAGGLPVGVQVIAAPHQDRLCLAMAKHLEDTFGGWTAPK
ncbi:fatty-acid amide hydrolase 2-A-like [Phlebotomus argentipes]|uniref:fatty-acid amide hydrolase 2-A-like n=1 Tax=Phlebotomus argentipes TaxID=94469 RepID=UPI002892A8A6|nr:fatty-acid amide hydrolase 2-A-like [Phlebotomus argentipes]